MAVVTLLAGISTPVSALTVNRYTPQARQAHLLAMSGPQLAQTQSAEFEQWFNQGSSLLQQQRYAEALKAFEQAIRLNSNSAEAWEGQGAALYGLEQYQEASVAFQKAVKLDPKFIAAWVELGNALDDAGQPMEALKAWYDSPEYVAVRAGRQDNTGRG